jgi:hypothetical protein
VKTIDEIRDAFLHVHHVAIGTSERSYMSIPADPQRDADLIVMAAIEELKTLRETVAEVRAEVSKGLGDYYLEGMAEAVIRILEKASK